MSAKVLSLPVLTRLDISPDRVIDALPNLKGVVIAGYTEEGEEYFASSYADGGDVLWLLERLKLNLLTVDIEDY